MSLFVMLLFIWLSKSWRDIDHDVKMSDNDKYLSIVFTGLEILDLIGDLSYLLFFPHSSAVIVWLLCFSLCLPFGFTFLVVTQDNGPLDAIKFYIRLNVFDKKTVPLTRLLIIGGIAVVENLV